MKKQRSKDSLTAAIVVVGILVAGLAAPVNGSPASAQSQTVAPIDLNDPDALDAHFGLLASAYCDAGSDGYLKELSNYEFKWDELQYLETRFDKYLRTVSAPGVITVVSDKVELQGANGTWQRVQLFCDYETQAEKVIRYSLQQ